MPNAITNLVRARVKTGTYTGDGTDNRNIDIGVNLAAAKNAYVIVKCYEDFNCIHRTEYGQGDRTMFYSEVTDGDNEIQQFTTTGFQIGRGQEANYATYPYRYIVFWEQS
jgi:hypothetical protein